MEGLDGGLLDMDWGVKIRLADLEMEDRPSFGLQGLRPGEHLEGGFRPEPVHPSGIGGHADYLLTGLPVSLPPHLGAVVPPVGVLAHPRRGAPAWRNIGHSGRVCQSARHMSAHRAGHPALMSLPITPLAPIQATLQLTSAGALRTIRDAEVVTHRNAHARSEGARGCS